MDSYAQRTLGSWCGASARVVSIDDGKSDDRDEAHERDPQRLRRVHDEGEVLRRLDSHTKGSEGNDDRSMPRPPYPPGRAR